MHFYTCFLLEDTENRHMKDEYYKGNLKPAFRVQPSTLPGSILCLEATTRMSCYYIAEAESNPVLRLEPQEPQAIGSTPRISHCNWPEGLTEVRRCPDSYVTVTTELGVRKSLKYTTVAGSS